MADEIRRLSAELARDPDSLVFLQLAEALRRRAELDAAAKVAAGGLERHPDLVDAHDLYARVLTDRGEFVRAGEQWTLALEREPRHIGALKGLAFLRFREGNLDAALDLLESALAADPEDQSVIKALYTVRQALEEAEVQATPSEDSVFAGLEGADRRIVLVDRRGRVLGGRLVGAQELEVTDEVAAFLAGAAQEAERTARMLGLGAWQWIVAEGPNGNAYVTAPTAETLLFIVRDRSVPAGRLALLADHAASVARRWLEAQRL